MHERHADSKWKGCKNIMNMGNILHSSSQMTVQSGVRVWSAGMKYMNRVCLQPRKQISHLKSSKKIASRPYPNTKSMESEARLCIF